jgi:DNA mismatch endonuclease (patch repair protein)
MDSLSSERRSANMARIRSKDTKPEMLIRRLLHGLGYRYALHRRGLPGAPDLVFPARKKIIFVHGCFWHQHKGCIDGRVPKSGEDYWGPKLRRNVERDCRNVSKLRHGGWKVIKVWECDISKVDSLRKRLVRFLGARRSRE